jgi:hypothetical protein
MIFYNIINYRLILVLLLIIIFLIGFYKIWKRKIVNLNNIKFASDFLKNLQSFYNSQGKDSSIYSWLINRSPKMQSIMGDFGVLSSYQPPYKNIVFNNYQIISNMIPELNKEYYDLSMTTSRIINMVFDTIQESIMRYIGNSEDIIEIRKKQLKNPILWFKEGIGAIILFPIITLNLFGLLSNQLIDSLSNNVIVKLIIFIVGLVGFVASIVTITIGWPGFINIVNQIF